MNVNAPEFILGMREYAGEAADRAPDLLSRAASGREAAFEQLMKIHERQVLLTALRLLGRLEDAQDAAQEVFLRLYRNLKMFSEVEQIRPWLYRVTVNVCRDQLRKRAHAFIELVETDMAVDDAADEQIGAEQRRALLAEALTRLPERERAAIVLREIEGLETEEVAEILGSTATTVRSQISTGRAKLRVARLMRRRV